MKNGLSDSGGLVVGIFGLLFVYLGFLGFFEEATVLFSKTVSLGGLYLSPLFFIEIVGQS